MGELLLAVMLCLVMYFNGDSGNKFDPYDPKIQLFLMTQMNPLIELFNNILLRRPCCLSIIYYKDIYIGIYRVFDV